MRISVNANFERRIGLFPAGLDADGNLFCNQNFADYPLEIPQGKFDPISIQPKWMLLSYHKRAWASSSEKGYPAEQALDENIRTSWCAKGSGGEWLCVDLGDICEVCGIQINFADVDVPVKQVDKALKSDHTTNQRWIDLNSERTTRWILEGSEDEEHWTVLIDKSGADTDLANDYVELEQPAKVRYFRLTARELPYGKKFAVSGLRVFGIGNMNAPEKVKDFMIEKIDDLTVKLRWKKAERAHGYNVRYGIAKDKLYLSHMVYGMEEVLLTALNKNQQYYFCVDSFGEGGITTGEVK